jgi:hypothetical protein
MEPPSMGAAYVIVGKSVERVTLDPAGGRESA